MMIILQDILATCLEQYLNEGKIVEIPGHIIPAESSTNVGSYSKLSSGHSANNFNNIRSDFHITYNAELGHYQYENKITTSFDRKFNKGKYYYS